MVKSYNIPFNSHIHSFNYFISRRAISKEPIAYLFKEKEFWSNNLIVNTNVLIPRPETELLVDKLIKYYRDSSPFVLDVGTGSGCIIISLLQEWKNSKAVAINISQKAIKIAKRTPKYIIHTIEQNLLILQYAI